MGAAAGPNIIEDGLVLALDAGNTKSYPSMPAITYVGGTSDSDNSTSFTLSGLQSGDLVLYFSAEDLSSVNTPTGASWTAIPGLSTQPDNDSDPSSAAFYVFATGTSVTASGLRTGDEHVRVMIAFRNVNSTNPFDVNATENSADDDNLPNPPSITPVTNNSMIVAIGFLDDEDIANTISPPTGYTTALNMDSQGGANDAGIGGATIMTAYKLLATAAAEDPGTFVSSNANGGDDDPTKGISIALRQATSSTWTDLIGSNDGTLTNGPTSSSDDGGYLEFDGSNQAYVLGAANPDLNWAYPGDCTVEMWVNVSSSSTYGTLFSTEVNAQEEEDNTFVITMNSSLQISLTTYSIVLLSASSATQIPQNTWTHIVVTRQGTTLTLYIDKSSAGSGFSSINYVAGGYSIGALPRSLSNTNFTGKVSNVRVYKGKALTLAEIEENYNALKGRYGY